MSETTFESAKVGDRCFSPLFKSVNAEDRTNATICAICDKSNPFQVSVEPDVAGFIGSYTFTIKGNYHSGAAAGQVLFWENPIHEIPVRPKRKVIKKGFIGVIPDKAISKGRIALTSNAYESRDCKLIPDGYQIIEIEFEVYE